MLRFTRRMIEGGEALDLVIKAFEGVSVETATANR
jgi:hypothetical protein